MKEHQKHFLLKYGPDEHRDAYIDNMTKPGSQDPLGEKIPYSLFRSPSLSQHQKNKMVNCAPDAALRRIVKGANSLSDEDIENTKKAKWPSDLVPYMSINNISPKQIQRFIAIHHENKDLMDRGYELLHKSGENPEVMHDLVHHAKTPQSLVNPFQQISRHTEVPEKTIHEFLHKSAKMPSDYNIYGSAIQRALSSTYDYRLRVSGAKIIPKAVMDKILDHPDTDVKAVANLFSDHASSDHLHKMIKSPDVDTRWYATRSKNFNAEHAKHLINDPEELIRKKALQTLSKPSNPTEEHKQ